MRVFDACTTDLGNAKHQSRYEDTPPTASVKPLDNDVGADTYLKISTAIVEISRILATKKSTTKAHERQNRYLSQLPLRNKH